jgi:hypothetical protein
MWLREFRHRLGGVTVDNLTIPFQLELHYPLSPGLWHFLQLEGGLVPTITCGPSLVPRVTAEWLGSLVVPQVGSTAWSLL